METKSDTLELKLGGEFYTGDGRGLGFKVVSTNKVVCTFAAPHWQSYSFKVGALYEVAENGNVLVPDHKLSTGYDCHPWITLRPDGKIWT
ncbi:MAG: hypothetical protein E6R04_02175 [Spirochaetes bacterium]|nr:MAG: hypothetical protein E6R04_02175 [Spirochaetota bacterium]